MDQICVDARMRGRGIGRRLLDWADQTCRDYRPDLSAPSAGTAATETTPLDGVAEAPRITRIVLEVVRDNPAVGWYKRRGYVIKEEQCCNRCCNV